MKKTYVTPEVIVHGTVEDITQGAGQSGTGDFNFFGGSDPYKCNTCDDGSGGGSGATVGGWRSW